MFQRFKNGKLKAKNVPQEYELLQTKMYDDIWKKDGIEEEEIFNEFYDHKVPFNSRYIEIRDASWRRFAKKLST